MRKYSKISGLITLIILWVMIIYGGLKIYTFVKNTENNADVFSASANQRFAVVKYNKKIQNDAKNASKNLLGNGIKFKASEFCGDNGRIVCYTRNVYIELDTNSMQPIYMFYECNISNPQKSIDECEKNIIQFVFRNIPRSAKAKDAVVCCDSFNEKTASYRVNFSNGTVLVVIRRDTGSVIFYDANELFY